MGKGASKIEETVNIGSASSSSNALAQQSGYFNSKDTFEIILIALGTYLAIELLKYLVRTYMKKHYKKQLKIFTIREQIIKNQGKPDSEVL